MSKTKRRIIIPLLWIVVLFCLAIVLFQISKSTTFQFFGGITHRVTTQEKIVALTFDDGPTEYTEEVLTILEDKNTVATFFLIGQQIEKNSELTKKIVEKGHQIGNHSYSHPRFYLKSMSFIEDEIQKTNELIRNAGYTDEIMFRPPYGKKLIGLPLYLSQQNMKTIMWDVSEDGGNTKEFIVNNALEHTKPGSIIIMHPNCKECKPDREAIADIIASLRAQGYTFVTVSDLLRYAGE